MAKDGTRRGGARAGAGRKPKSMADKLNEGMPVTLKPVDLFSGQEVVSEKVNSENTDTPPMKGFLTAEQKHSVPLETKTIYEEVYAWLKAHGCEEAVSQQLIDQYVMSVARWMQCEQAISENGFITAHPTTGGAIASPYVQMSQAYMKQINSIWYQIYQIVKENCTGEMQSADPMEQLLG